MLGTVPGRDRHGRPHLDPTHIAGPVLWIPLILSGILAALLFAAAGFTIHPQLFSGAGAYVVAVLAAQELQRRGIARWLSDFILYNSYLTLLGTVGMMAAYAAAASGTPLVEHSLLAMDQALGYDWVAYARFYVEHEWAARLILPAYTLAYVVPTLTITALVATRRAVRVERYLLAMLIATALTVALFALFPARTAWAALDLPLDQIQALKYLPMPNDGWQRDLMTIRTSGASTITMASGLIAFPSLHCITALLAAWAIWPVKRLRWPLLAINVATLLSTPIIGGHFMVDMIGGIGVALIAAIAATHFHTALLRLRIGRAIPASTPEPLPA